MKISVLTSLVIAAFAATPVLAGEGSLTRDEVRSELSQAQSRGGLSYNDHNYGTWWNDTASTNVEREFHGSSDMSSAGAAGRSHDSADSSTRMYRDGGPATAQMNAPASGMSNDYHSSSSTAGSDSSSSGAYGAAGRSYGGSDSMGRDPGTRERDSARFNDIDGLVLANDHGTWHGTGAAGRAYGIGSGSMSRSEVAADRDSAMRSGDWVVNDLDGVRHLYLYPGESSATGETNLD